MINMAAAVSLMLLLNLTIGSLSVVSAISGNASLYSFRSATACYSSIDNDEPYTASASDTIWDNKKACGRSYKITCIGSSSEGCDSWTPSITVRLVDYCPLGCTTTIQLSKSALEKIAPFLMDSGIIKIEYTSADSPADAPPPINEPSPVDGNGPPPINESASVDGNGGAPKSTYWPSRGHPKRSIIIAVAAIGSFIAVVMFGYSLFRQLKLPKQILMVM